MTYLKNIVVAVCITALALDFPRKTEGNPYVISDDRVRNLDVTPVLGRGYSIMTNSFQSTCLKAQEITIPSFNYDYSFHEFSSSLNIMEDLGSALSESFAYGSVKEEFEETYDSTTTSTSNTHYVIASMRIERYYASVKEESSSITPEASSLIENQDYVGFFKACGPNYVRSIRRAQEVVAMFKFETKSTEQAENFAKSLQVAGEESEDGTVQINTDTSSVSKSLTIKITGYGLGLMEEGSDTLMATTLEQFNGVMSYAYNTMTKNPNAHHIGMIYGIEVLPWAENVLFQVAANVASTDIEIPVERSLIPRAYNKTNITDYEFDPTDTLQRGEFKCPKDNLFIDRYGYCCEAQSMYDHAKQEYNADDLTQRACRPIRSLGKVFVKENLAGNGEFVARLDRALRYKTNTLGTLQKCISSIRGYPASVDDNLLVPHADPLNSDSSAQITVLDMKTAMDPFNDYSMVKHMGREIDEFIIMYYSPCLNALFGGTDGATDPSYFMAYPWYKHTECGYMSCLASGMRWDRENGGCIPGLMSGSSTQSYPASDANAKCAYDTEAGGDTQTCKYTATDLNDFQDRMKNCWDNGSTHGFSVEMFLTNYCMPKVSARKMSSTDFATLKGNIPTDCGGSTSDAAQSDPVPSRYMSAAARAKASADALNKQRREERERRRLIEIVDLEGE